MKSPLRRFWLGFDRLMLPSLPASRLGAFRALVCLVALYDVMLYSSMVFADAELVGGAGERRPWTPIFLFQVLQVQPIGPEMASIVYQVAIVSLLLGALGVCSRWSCAVGAIAFFYWTGLAYSFGKPHHDKVALAFCMASLPFARVGAAVSVDAWVRRKLGRPQPDARYVAAMPIRLGQATLALGYCGAGLSKLLLGGLDWFNGYTLQGIMLGHQGYWSFAVGQSPTLCQIQSIFVVTVQACFPLVIFWPRSRWFFLPAAMSFHLMTWMTMDTGPYMRVWLLLFVFTPMEQIPEWLRRRLSGPKGPAAVVALAVLVYCWLVGGVALSGVPLWGVLALAAVLVVSFVRYCAAHGWNRQPAADTTLPQ